MSLSAAAAALVMIGNAAPDASALAPQDIAGGAQAAPQAAPVAEGAPTAPASIAPAQSAGVPAASVAAPATPVAPAAAASAETAPAADAASPAGTTAAPDAAPAQPATDAAAPQENGQDAPDIVVTRHVAPPGDPLEKINTESFQVTQSVDKALVEPVAQAYNKGLPRPIRQGLRNFFSNLGEPVVFAAYLLQFKPGKAAETAGRFAINSTIGVAGVFDMAKRKPFNLPYRPNGLADTLGYYGVGPGPFMYLPIVGPTTLRDILGDSIDRLLVPAIAGKPFAEPAFAIPATVFDQLGERAAFDATIQKIRKEDKPYAAYRELYLQQRKAEIEALHGRTVSAVPVYGPGMNTPSRKDSRAAPQEPAAPSEQPAAQEPAVPQAVPAPDVTPQD